MIDSGYGAPMYEGNMLGYSTVETILDDVSRQMASSNLSRRCSRGSTSQRPGTSMRVVKPNSASNSPRGSGGLARRRTVTTDASCRRRAVMTEHFAGGMVPTNDGSNTLKNNRPMSWHPSMGTQSIQQDLLPLSGCHAHAGFPAYDLPPTPAVYSGYTSPSSAFSPLSLPYTEYDQQQYMYQSNSQAFYPSAPSSTSYQAAPFDQLPQSYVTPANNADSAMYSHFDWSNFATNGFESSTAPPTPDNFLPIQHPETAFPSEDSIPYHPLSDSEDGEELIGMGLYDTPDLPKLPSSESQFDSYRALMMSQFLGSGYRNSESTGKGLKLEDAWAPPASDDGEEDDEDGEGEAEEEISVPPVEAPRSQQDPSIGTSNNPQGQYTQGYVQNGWL
ncbi:hypothetical protein PVAG01_05121 [Phlyctema vagabunda]|uniref:Uncharacterized protein n=1 Tax=Phlyctema vagabunda TaxID=108571 RepID=A0ABR4PJA9_9HELO